MNAFKILSNVGYLKMFMLCVCVCCLFSFPEIAGLAWSLTGEFASMYFLWADGDANLRKTQ